MGKYKKNNKQLNTLGKREKLTEAPDDLGFLTDDEIEEQERQEFEKRLAQRKAQSPKGKYTLYTNSVGDTYAVLDENLKEELEAGDCVYHQGRDAYYYLKKHNDKSFELYEYRYGHLVEAHPFIIDIGSPFYKQLRLQTKRAMPNLKESWIQFTFEDGSNPYVAKTKEEQDRMFKKYKGRVEQVGDITYLVKSEKKKTNESLKESKTVIPEKANLKKILDRYESNGKFAKQGNWKIARGGYDLAFQLMYDDLALIDGIHSVWDDTTGLHLDVATYGANNEYNTNELANYICQVYTDCKVEGNLKEDTVKKGNKWVNKGNTGKTHGEFKTKKQADAQRKAMFVNKKKNSN